VWGSSSEQREMGSSKYRWLRVSFSLAVQRSRSSVLDLSNPGRCAGG